MHRPLVSILVNNYNYGRFLREAVDSALGQEYPHAEVIVVDDGSTDESREIIAGYGGRITPVLKENGGQASALNAGFAASRGEIVCFLDSDDVFLPGKVAEVVAVFECHEDVGCCFHPYSLVDNDGDTLRTGTLLEANDEGLSCEWDLRLHIERGKLPKGDELGFAAPGLLGMCFKRSLLRRILPMPEAASVSISDNYIRFMSCALSKGFFLNRVLALQRIHGKNIYTFSNDERLWASIRILTAYWMRANLPSSARFTNKMLAAGIGRYWRIGEIKTEHRTLVDNYLHSVSSAERVEILLRSFYHYLKPRERVG